MTETNTPTTPEATAPVEATPTLALAQPITAADALVQLQRREALKISRVTLADMTGLSLSRIWASEQAGKVVIDEHRGLIAAALESVEKNGLPAKYVKAKAEPKAKASQPKQATKAELLAQLTDLTSRMERVVQIAQASAELKSLKDLRATIEEMRRAASGDPNGEPSFVEAEPSTEATA